MKNQLFIALALLIFGSCKKVDEYSVPGRMLVQQNYNAPVENLGHVFSGTNVSWKIHPLNPNNSPLFTTQPNQSTGFCMLMIDNGIVDGATPINPFKFVVANLQTGTSKVIPVAKPDGSLVTYPLGRITKYVFGMDRKFYVGTEGGGHLVQYDPNTQKAIDLGTPFQKAGRTLDIYSLNVGSDSALYGGSFGGDGDVMTFRYKNGQMQVDQQGVDNQSRYVVNVSGDSRYTYVLCGKNNWFVYAIDRTNGNVKTLLNVNGSASPLEMATHTDGTYAHMSNIHYKLNGTSIASLGANVRPASARLYYVPYAADDNTLPKVIWDGNAKKVRYQLASGIENAISVANITEDVYPTGPMMYANNKLFIAGSIKGLLAAYSPMRGIENLGSTSMGIHAMAAPLTGTNDKIFLAGYPKGGLIEFTPAQAWTVSLNSFSTITDNYATSGTNPKQSALFQNEDAAGVHGSMAVYGLTYTKHGYVINGGNNDRITTTASRELSIGNFKSGTVRNLYNPEFANHEFRTLCLAKDSLTAFIGTMPKNGTTAKIYKYDPAANKVTSTYELPVIGKSYNHLMALTNDLLVGSYDDAIFIYNLQTGGITWQNHLGSNQRIYALNIAPDNSVYIVYTCRQTTNYKVSKVQFSTSGALTAKTEQIAEFTDADMNERTKPESIAFSNNGSGIMEMYISGLNSLYKVKL